MKTKKSFGRPTAFLTFLFIISMFILAGCKDHGPEIRIIGELQAKMWCEHENDSTTGIDLKRIKIVLSEFVPRQTSDAQEIEIKLYEQDDFSDDVDSQSSEALANRDEWWKLDDHILTFSLKVEDLHAGATAHVTLECGPCIGNHECDFWVILNSVKDAENDEILIGTPPIKGQVPEEDEKDKFEFYIYLSIKDSKGDIIDSHFSNGVNIYCECVNGKN
jgi:hypothetical protein